MPTDVIALTRELVRMPSHDDDDDIVEYLAEWLATRTGAAVTVDEANNVIARRGSGPTSLAFVGHHDVVEPAPSQISDKEYRVTQQDGRLYGRGTADMKGSLAAMAVAFAATTVPADAGELVFASFAGEELGGVGVQHAIDGGFAPDRAVVGEGSTGYSAAGVTDVAVAHKGRRGSTFETQGRAAHASEPAAGDNAIYRACDVVEAIANLEPPETTVRGEFVSGSVTVTEIEGGTAWNVIPDECRVIVDERTVPDDRADLSAIASSPSVTWTVDQDLPPMACTDESFIETALAAAKSSQAGSSNAVVKPHATDAGWLADAGVACLVVGAAEPGEAHTDNESVGIETLRACEEIYRQIAAAVLEQ